MPAPFPPLPRLGLPALTAAAAVACAALVPLPAARAEDPPPRETRFFETYDKDLDGKVTSEEFTAGQGDAASFALLDRNQDGAVTPDELGLPADYKPKPRPPGSGGAGPAAPGGPGARGGELRRRFKEMDKDGDGKLTREEWAGDPAGFDRYDRNKDGVLDAQDLPPPGGAGGPGMPPGGKGQPGGRPDLEQIKARWKSMDKDGDGKVAKDEYAGELPFDRLDADKDGFLTEADLKAFKGPGRGPSPEELERRFGELDKDGSGKVEAAECPEAQREKLLRGDKDGDGSLSKDEFLELARRGPRPEGGPRPDGGPGAGPGPELLQRFDHDRDGKVTREQFPGSDEQFARLDRDGDGVLTAKDFPPAPPGGAAPGGPAPQGEGRPAPSLAELDRDGDGRLSRAEFKGSDDDWRRLDLNHDGWISPDELK